MNTLHVHHKQNGFFDLGVSLVLLAVFGTTAIVVNSNNTDETQQGHVAYSETVEE